MLSIYFVPVAVATVSLITVAVLLPRKMPPRRRASWWARLPWGLAFVLAGCSMGPPMGGSGGGGGGAATITTTTTITQSVDAGQDAPAPCVSGDYCPLPDGGEGLCVAGACVPAPNACTIPACPAGWSSVCMLGDGFTACCNGAQPVTACSRPSGILTHDCAASCTSGECTHTTTVSPKGSPAGAETCCSFGSPEDPCRLPVP